MAGHCLFFFFFLTQRSGTFLQATIRHHAVAWGLEGPLPNKAAEQKISGSITCARARAGLENKELDSVDCLGPEPACKNRGRLLQGSERASERERKALFVSRRAGKRCRDSWRRASKCSITAELGFYRRECFGLYLFEHLGRFLPSLTEIWGAPREMQKNQRPNVSTGGGVVAAGLLWVYTRSPGLPVELLLYSRLVRGI